MIGYFEDMHVGEQTNLGSHTFSAEDIVRFAKKFDPQPFHIDEEEAQKSHFGKLIASGWHTVSIWNKLLVKTHAQALKSSHPNNPLEPLKLGPSPGFTDLKWHKPVYMDDTIAYSSRITAKRPLSSRPSWGLVETRNEGHNQKGVLVFSFNAKVFIARNKG